jgi:hypothetical protein
MQNFSNHSRYVPLYHFVGYGLLLAAMIGSFVNLYHAAQAGQGVYSASLICVLCFVVLLSLWFARAFALKAQDRAIRAEENFRHYILTGKPFDSRLRMRHIVALRFAPDEEFVALAKRAAEENLSQKEIKMAIKNWKPDYSRV